jgi:hypothetical protein
MSVLDEFLDTWGAEYSEGFGVLDLRSQHHDARNTKAMIGVEVADGHDV